MDVGTKAATCSLQPVPVCWCRVVASGQLHDAGRWGPDVSLSSVDGAGVGSPCLMSATSLHCLAGPCWSALADAHSAATSCGPPATSRLLIPLL